MSFSLIRLTINTFKNHIKIIFYTLARPGPLPTVWYYLLLFFILLSSFLFLKYFNMESIVLKNYLDHIWDSCFRTKKSRSSLRSPLLTHFAVDWPHLVRLPSGCRWPVTAALDSTGRVAGSNSDNRGDDVPAACPGLYWASETFHAYQA